MSAFEPASKTKWVERLRRFCGSPFCLLIVLLLLVDSGMCYWQSRDKATQCQLNPRLVAIRGVIEGERKPDIVLLGDSLIHSALYSADANLGLMKDKKQSLTYLETRFVQQLVSKKVGRSHNVDLLNLSIPGAGPTDAYLILSELKSHDKLPKLVVYGLSPRALIDNLCPTGGAIGGKFAFSVAPKEKDNPSFFDQIDSLQRKLCRWEPVANAIREYGQLGDSPTNDQLRNYYVGLGWHYFHDRSKVYDQLNQLTLCAFNRRKPESVVASAAPDTILAPKKRKRGVAGKEKMHVDKAAFERELDNYNARYNPPNFKKLERQSEMLEKCAQLVEENDGHLLIVNMPITEENKRLIDRKMFFSYQKELKTLSTTDGVTTLDLWGAKDFTPEDFLDSVHLNGEGAKMFDRKLTSSIDCSWL
ncbi:MAG: hypothetical protein K2Z81_26880 [Cyanobacteria bacterium]|nr:hypothetical protein [Cyanobacteriota bacterium]